jgi:hypothetical protein
MQRMVLKSLLATCAAATIASATFGASAEQVRSVRIVTSSENMQITKADHTIGFRRLINPHKTVANLPPDAEPDQEFIVDDLAENFREIPVTVLPPDGHLIARHRPQYDLIVNGGHFTFRYLGEKLWSVEP